MPKAQAGVTQASQTQAGRSGISASATLTGTATVDGSSNADVGGSTRIDLSQARASVSQSSETQAGSSKTVTSTTVGTATVEGTGSVDAVASASIEGTATVVSESTRIRQSPAVIKGTATANATPSRVRAVSGHLEGRADVTGRGTRVVVPVWVGDIAADDIVDQETPTLQVGETATLQLLFSNPLGDYEIDDPIDERYETALDYLKTATDGVVDSGTDDAGNAWFRESLPESASVDTQLVEISSHPTVDNDLPSMWGVIVGGSDQSQAIAESKRVDVDVFILGSVDDFADEAEVRELAELTIGADIGDVVTKTLAEEPAPTLTRGTSESLSVTVDVDGTDYSALRDFLAYANDSVLDTGSDDSGNPWFREAISDQSNVSSLLVPVDPDTTQDGFEGFWALIEAGEETSPPSGYTRDFDLDLFVLATQDEYATEADVRNATEIDVGYDIGNAVARALAEESAPTLTRGTSETISVNVDLDGTSYEVLRDYLSYANDGVLDTDVDDAGNPWFREALPDQAPVSSLLTSVELDTDSDGFEDFWALVEGGEESSPPHAQSRDFDLDLYVLATHSDYSDETDVRDATEIDVTHSIGGYVGDALADASIPTVSVGSEESVTVALNNIHVDTNVSDYLGLKDYLRYPESVETETDGAGRAAFEETIPDISPVSSQLVKVETDGRSDDGMEDFWAVVTGGSETEPAAPTGRQLELNLFVLGTVDQYPTESSIRDATELDLSWQVGNLLADGLATEAAPVLTRGEQVSVSFRFDNSDSDYESLKQYLAYPSVESGTTERGVPWFRERIPDISPVDTQLVQVQPDARSDAGFSDFWGIIEGGSEETAPYPNERTVSVDLTVLGTVSEYPTESDVRDLESEPL